MSRGRKASSNGSVTSMQKFLNKNTDAYVKLIFIRLGKAQKLSEESSLELVKQIKAEKEKLVSEKKLKKDSNLPPIKPEDVPYVIPNNWAWCRLGEISLNFDEARIPISQLERDNRAKIYNYYGASGIIDKIDGYTHDGKYLLIGEDGANLKAKSTPIAFIAKGKFWVNNHAHVLGFVHDITLDFMSYCFNAMDILPFITGGFQPKLSQGNLNMIPVPLPPISEQRNILAFLDDFKNGCLKPNKCYFDSDVELTITSLHSSQLKNLELANEFTIQDNLLFQLRQSFLREAMQGKLVKQDPKDGHAKDLLEKIKAEKAKSGRKEKEIPPIKSEEIPFEIPENWVWCRLSEVGRITGGGTPSMSNSEYWNGNIPWVSPKDMGVEFVSNTEMKVTKKGVEESTTNLIPTGSLLIVGRSGILKRKLPVSINKVECTVNQDMKVIIPYIPLMNRFLQLMFNGLEGIILKDYVKFGMTVHSLKYNEFALMPIPLPPLKQQAKIVGKLEELLMLCDSLQKSIQDSREQNELLLQQVLKEALTQSSN